MTAAPEAPLRIEIWSDPVCPFCYMGEHRLKAGIAAYGGPVRIVYRSFQLRPDLPAGSDTNFVKMFASRRGVSVEQARELIAPSVAQAASLGLVLDYERARPTNTRKAHELLHFADEKGWQEEMAERIFRAYFSEGLLISDPDVLADLAAECGLARSEVDEALAEGRFIPAVEADIAAARAIGVTGVPFTLIEGSLAVSGSQSPETFAGALRQAAKSREAS